MGYGIGGPILSIRDYKQCYFSGEFPGGVFLRHARFALLSENKKIHIFFHNWYLVTAGMFLT